MYDVVGEDVIVMSTVGWRRRWQVHCVVAVEGGVLCFWSVWLVRRVYCAAPPKPNGKKKDILEEVIGDIHDEFRRRRDRQPQTGRRQLYLRGRTMLNDVCKQ